MRDILAFIQRVGLILIVTAGILLFTGSSKLLVFLFICISSGIIVIVDGLIGEISRMFVIAIVSTLLTVMFYFLLGEGILLGILLGASIIMISGDLIRTMKLNR